MTNKVSLNQKINSLIERLTGFRIEKSFQSRLERYLSSNDWLKKINFSTIIDIGANEGQFLTICNKIFPSSRKIAIEPSINCFRSLEEKFKGERLITLYNCGVGSSETEMVFNENDFSPTSSFLTPTYKQEQLFPGSSSLRCKSKVYIKMLDSIVKEEDFSKVLVKMDVQGFEKEVIKGGIKTLEKSDFLIIEGVFEPFYEGQATFKELYDILSNLGFEFRDVVDVLYSPSEGPIQIDALFVNSNKHTSE